MRKYTMRYISDIHEILVRTCGDLMTKNDLIEVTGREGGTLTAQRVLRALMACQHSVAASCVGCR